MKFIFWCEFPKKTNWEKLAKWLNELNMNITTYITTPSRKDFAKQKVHINKISKRITVNAWPILPKEKGYWFTGFTKKEDIDLLDEFRDVEIKIDVEPPIFKQKYTLYRGLLWFIQSLKKCPNKKYLQKKIEQFDKNGNIIVSTFPLPKLILKHWGWKKAKKLNFMHYSSFLPIFIRPLYNFFYQFFIKANKGAYIAIGLIGPGIFNTEPTYKKINEFEKDLKFLKKNKVKTALIFELSAITKRGKHWLKLIKQYGDQ